MGRRTGIFVSLEGGEGSGKTTQGSRIVAYLRSLGREVLETREPGGTPAGELIRDILLHSVSYLCARTELALYLASRAQLVAEVIQPALARGVDVVCDRYADSSTAYQGGGRDLGIDFVEKMNDWATGSLTPDLTFFFDIAPATGLERHGERSDGGKLDRIEREALGFHERVRATYLELARRHPQRFHVISADRPEKDVWKEVQVALGRKLASSPPGGAV